MAQCEKHELRLRFRDKDGWECSACRANRLMNIRHITLRSAERWESIDTDPIGGANIYAHMAGELHAAAYTIAREIDALERDIADERRARDKPDSCPMDDAERLRDIAERAEDDAEARGLGIRLTR